jgi:hypothetical protein
MSEAMEMTIFYSPVEGSDYDFVTLTNTPDADVYTAVQLKELVPNELTE